MASRDADGLTPRQAAFVREFLVDNNATQAAIRAGYAPNSAGPESSRLLTNDTVAAAVARAQAQRASRINITADTVLHEMSMLALSRIDHYVITDDGQVALAEGAPEDAMAAVQSIKRKTRVHCDPQGNITGKTYEVEIRLWDKPTPLKLTGRHVGLYPDRVEHVGKGGGPIELTEVSTEELLARHRALSEAAAPTEGSE